MIFLLLQLIRFKARSGYKFLRFISGLVRSFPLNVTKDQKSYGNLLTRRLQRRLENLQRILKRTCWSDYVSRVDLLLSFLSSRKKNFSFVTNQQTALLKARENWSHVSLSRILVMSR